MKTRLSTTRAITTFSMLALCGSALAGPVYTPVNNPPGAELSHTAILQNIYGGAWSATAPGSINRGNGLMTAMRVADGGLGVSTSLMTGNAANSEDAVFNGQTVQLVVRAKYAGDSHIFGWIDDTQAAPTFQPIISTSSFDQPVSMMLSSSFRWALKDLTTGLTVTSRPTDNIGTGSFASQSFDQLTTYHVTGKGDVQNEWVLFWEDRVSGQNSDYDYNDAAITISIVPPPGSIALGGMGMLLLGRRRRKS
jgi:uncharacterized protein (TIGR03382 family)